MRQPIEKRVRERQILAKKNTNCVFSRTSSRIQGYTLLPSLPTFSKKNRGRGLGMIGFFARIQKAAPSFLLRTSKDPSNSTESTGSVTRFSGSGEWHSNGFSHMLTPEGFHQVDFRGFLLEVPENERRKVPVNKDRHIVSSRNVSNSLVNSAPFLRKEIT